MSKTKNERADIYNKRGYRKITQEELTKLQDTLLSMYKDIYEVCKKYNITPYLCGGSALGAIRHQGFIPWDDDLDIAMIRNEYEVLKAVFKRELGDKYILCSPDNENCKMRFPKIVKKGTIYQEIGSTRRLNGIFIDIFLIDYLPSNKLEFYTSGINCNLLELISSCVYDKKYLDKTGKDLLKKAVGKSYYIRNCIGAIFSYKSPESWFNSINNVAKKAARGNRVGLLTGSEHYFGEIFDYDTIFPAKYVKFCDIEAPVFNKVKLYLENLYGDFMKVPKESERVSHNISEIDFGD